MLLSIAFLVLACASGSKAALAWPTDNQLRESLLEKRGVGLYYGDNVQKLQKMKANSRAHLFIVSVQFVRCARRKPPRICVTKCMYGRTCRV